MRPSLLRRLINNLPKLGKKGYPHSFVKEMLQADVVSAPFRNDNAFRPNLEVLEDRLAPTVSFAPNATFAVGLNPAITATADINGDGKPDIIAANYQSTTVSVLLNTTANGATVPTFSAQNTFTVGSSPNGVAVADINGDGRPDLAVTNYAAGSTTITILLNTTAPAATAASFTPQQTFSVGGYSSTVAFADINGDGRADLAVATKFQPSIAVFMNQTSAGATTATFSPLQTFATGIRPYAIQMADVNGDGRPDVVVSDYVAGPGNVSILLNTTGPFVTTPSFAAQQTFTASTAPFGLALADINGDGRPDLAFTNYKASVVETFLNTTGVGSTTVSFAASQTFATGTKPLNLAFGDFNGDGKPDIVVGNAGDNTISVLENATGFGATSASFVAQQTFATGGTTGAAVPAVADFNYDGRADIVVSNGGATGSSVAVFLNNLPVSGTTVTGPVQVGDFTGYGVQQFNRTANVWAQLTAADSTVFAANAAGYVVGSFSNGVNLYRPGVGWTLITPSQATSIDIDALGDIVANFSGYGVYYYHLSTGWAQIATAQSAELKLDGYGNVYGTFTGYGINKYRPAFASWDQLTPVTPTKFAVNAYGQIVGDFNGGGYNGVYRFSAYIGWQQVVVGNSVNASSLSINSYGVIFASFPGYGVDTIAPAAGAWTNVSPSNGSNLNVDRFGRAFGSYSGYGTYSYFPLTGWTQNAPIAAAALSVADWPFSLSSPF